MNQQNRLCLIPFQLFLLILCQALSANPEAEQLYNAGLAYYQQKNYLQAIEQLEGAIELEPDNPQYQHILAVSYGRAAEQANWFSAIGLARKTLEHLEIAANLDKHNLEILDDLMDYYREAPIFLGGDRKKADEIENLIEKLSQNKEE